jgi:putative membrane protein insertion efficiency factor
MTIQSMRDFAKHVTLWLLRGYKWAISPMFPPACRYVPTCSEYAMEAVERYGALHGGWMAMGRVLRCHPLRRGGLDPVVKTPFEASGAASSAEVPSASSGQALRFAQDDKIF